MFIANEGKKSLEVKANYIDPLGGCGCAGGDAVKTATRDLLCKCVCGTIMNTASGTTAGRDHNS